MSFFEGVFISALVEIEIAKTENDIFKELNF